MPKIIKIIIPLLLTFICTKGYCQNIFIMVKSDSSTSKRNCDVYFIRIANVRKQVINVPTEGFYSFRCPIEKTFEVVLDCWPDKKVLDKIFLKCGDSIVVNLDKRTFYNKNVK